MSKHPMQAGSRVHSLKNFFVRVLCVCGGGGGGKAWEGTCVEKASSTIFIYP